MTKTIVDAFVAEIKREERSHLRSKIEKLTEIVTRKTHNSFDEGYDSGYEHAASDILALLDKE